MKVGAISCWSNDANGRVRGSPREHLFLIRTDVFVSFLFRALGDVT